MGHVCRVCSGWLVSLDVDEQLHKPWTYLLLMCNHRDNMGTDFASSPVCRTNGYQSWQGKREGAAADGGGGGGGSSNVINIVMTKKKLTVCKTLAGLRSVCCLLATSLVTRDPSGSVGTQSSRRRESPHSACSSGRTSALARQIGALPMEVEDGGGQKSKLQLTG